MRIEIRGPLGLEGIEEDIETFLQDDPYLPFYYVSGLQTGEQILVLRRRLYDAYCWTATKDGKIVGLAAAQGVAFDADLLGIKSGRIVHMFAPFSYKEALNVYFQLAIRIIEWSKESGVKLLHARIDARNINLLHALEEVGFRIVTTNVMHILDTETRSELPVQPALEVEVTACLAEEREAVCAIASTAYNKNRFAMDPHIADAQSSALYRHWTESALTHPHKHVLVARRGGEVVGYLIGTVYAADNALLSRRIGAAELGTVRRDFHDSGVMTKLTQGMLDLLMSQIDATEAYMAVWNRPIISVYSNLGFMFRAAQHDLHFWDENVGKK